MSDTGDRLPGDLLRKLLERMLTRRLLDEVVIPTLADLQYEGARVRQASVWRRAFVLTRGHLGVWSALALCLATWPARSLRRDWLEADAAGPRLLQTLTPRACALGLGLTLLMGTQRPYRLALLTRDPWLSVLGLPSILVVVVPAAFFFGLILAFGRLSARSSASAAKRPLGAAVGLSMASGLLTFGLCAWLTPEANQAFRERASQLSQGPGSEGTVQIPKGARELTLGELQALTPAEHDSGRKAAALYVEWHKKWAIPAMCLVFGPLAIGLDRLPRRFWSLTTLALAGAATVLSWGALRFGEQAALSGRIGPLPAMWTGNVLLALVACWLIARHRSFDEGVTIAA